MYKRQVIDWIDLTEEGKASVLGELKAIDGVISISGISLRVEGLKSLSGTYVVGVLPKALSSQFASRPDIYFVAYDPIKEGVYEAVAVDADMDLVLTNETVLYPVSYTHLDVYKRQSLYRTPHYIYNGSPLQKNGGNTRAGWKARL